jgi:hypothetical protein
VAKEAQLSATPTVALMATVAPMATMVTMRAELYIPKQWRYHGNDHFDVELANLVKRAISVVSYHRIGQFSEMAISTLQNDNLPENFNP